MKGNDLDTKELRKEINRIKKNLSRRIERIEADKSLPQYAVQSYRGFEKRTPSKLKGLSKDELTKIYRNIKYIDNLKSSTIKGAKYTKKVYEPVKEQLESLTPKTREKFWSVYDRLIERNALLEQFKYELYQTDIDFIYSGSSVDEAFEEIINAYDDVLEELGDDYEDETVKLLFTERLQDIRK